MFRKHKQKILKRNKNRYIRKAIIYFVFIMTFLYGVSFWSNFHSFQIEKINVFGNRFIDTDLVKAEINNELSGKYIFLIPKKNFLFIPKSQIRKKLESNVTIENIEITKSDLQTITIEILEYKPIASYCVTENDCYFVNKFGTFFVKAPEVYLDNLIELKTTKEFGGEILGQNFVDKDIFEKLLEKIDLLKGENIEIREIYTEDFETFNLKTISGPTIIVEKEDKPEEIISNLKSAINQESINEVQFNNIDYIDLRFEDKVFYKLK